MWWHGLHFLLAFGGSHPQPPAETPTFWAPQAVLLQINSNLGWTPKNASGVAQSISHFVTQKRSTSVVQKQRFQTCAPQAFRCNISIEGWGRCERRKDDEMRLGKLLFAQNKVAVCRAGLLLFQVWNPLWGATFWSVFFKSLQWHQCCFCQETAADETASLAVASKVSVASSVEAAF